MGIRWPQNVIVFDRPHAIAAANTLQMHFDVVAVKYLSVFDQKSILFRSRHTHSGEMNVEKVDKTYRFKYEACISVRWSQSQRTKESNGHDDGEMPKHDKSLQEPLRS